MPVRLIGYVRVSQVRGREGDSFISPDVQRTRIEGVAAAHGHTIAEWIEDLDQSGGKTDRPGLQRALALVEQRAADGIAVARLDRFARSTLDTEMLIRRIEAAGGAFLSADLNLDTSTPVGKLVRTFLAAIAEFELDRIRENWRAATERHIARGAHHGRPPIGYDKDVDGRLVANKDADTVREIFRRRAAGESWLTIRRATGDRWGRSTIYNIVRNPTYLGHVRAGEYELQDAHEPLIDRATWEAAQAAPMLTPARERGSLLAGLIVCDGCGYRMSVEWDGRRGYANYACRKHHSGQTCPSPSKISMRRADGFVEDQFLGWAAVRLTGAADNTLQAAANAALAHADAELAAYVSSTPVSLVGERVFQAGLEERQARVESARAEVADVRHRGAVVALSRGSDLADEWPRLRLEERRLILSAAVAEVRCCRAHLRGQGTPVGERLRVRWSAAIDLPFDIGVPASHDG